MKFPSNRINVFATKENTNFEKTVVLSEGKKYDTVVIFSDGSNEALKTISKMDISRYDKSIKNIGIMQTPLYECRVLNSFGETSNPTFLMNEEDIDKWFCTRVASPHFEIYVRSNGSESKTHSKLNKGQTVAICYMVSKLYQSVMTVEDQLAFPASVIDSLVFHSDKLHSNTLTTEDLIEMTGLNEISYNSKSDSIQYNFNEDIFSVRRDLLKKIFDENISELTNIVKLLAIDILDMQIKVVGLTEYNDNIVRMSPSELGRLVESFRKSCIVKTISEKNPIDNTDLLKYIPRAIVTDKNSIWTTSRNNFRLFVETNSDFIRGTVIETV